MKIKVNKNAVLKNMIIFYDAKKQVQLAKSVEKLIDKAILDDISRFLQKNTTQDNDQTFQKFNTADFNEIILIDSTKIKNDIQAVKSGAELFTDILHKSKKEYELIMPQNLKWIASFVEGLYLAQYDFEFYKSLDTQKKAKKTTVQIISDDKESLDRCKEVQAKLDGVLLARDSANHPGNVFTPKQFKKEAEKIADEYKLKIEVLNDKDMKKKKMGCFCAVAQGTNEDSFMISVEYKTKEKNADTILVVGKGLTFDTGGISIKPSASMEEMKFDMCGGAAVLGLIKSIAQIKPKVNVVCMIGTTENMPGGKAIKPGDIVQAYNKKYVEVINTDAEGRLVLADTLAYGIEKYKPNAVINFATLTGACVVALGKHNAGLFSNSKKLVTQLTQSGLAVGEHVWSMPMDELYNEQIKGVYSDLKNVGDRYGGSITAAKFLEHFVDKTPWAHIDIAGTAWNVPHTPYFPKKGATGFGVRLMLDFLMNWK